jgi:NuA3 HAT complex component NTO1
VALPQVYRLSRKSSRKLLPSPSSELTRESCLLCPNEGGAFKQTTTGHWAHLLCAIWIPELSVGNAIYMEPVEGVETIPKNRWKLVSRRGPGVVPES